MIQVRVNGNILETKKGERIKYSKQVNDIADISTSQSNYTNSFKVPKTPNNIQVLDYLSVVGNGSKIPYKKITAELLDDGIPLMSNGWLNVKESSRNEYDIAIIDGIIDFFKAIENKKFGTDIDISELNHTKDVQTVIDSFDNEFYTYLVNDYGGKTNLETIFTPFNIDYLVPSARIKYLWDRMFESFGFTYSGAIFQNEDFVNAWLTYPKTNSELIQTDVFDLEMNSLPGNMVWISSEGQNERYALFSGIPWTSINIAVPQYALLYPRPNRMDRIEIQQTDNYQFKINFDATGTYTLFRGLLPIHRIEMPLKLRLFKNGTLIQQIIGNSEDVIIPVSSSQGDVYTLGIYSLTTAEFWQYYNNTDLTLNPNDWNVDLQPSVQFNSLSLEMFQVQYAESDFNDTFKDLDLKSFFKEVMWRFGLTAIPNNENRNIEFLTSDEMIDKGRGIIDWSDKYVGKQKESYSIGSYAQLNYLKQKYNAENSSYADGVIPVSNENLQDQNTLLTSKIYAPENSVTKLPFGFLFAEVKPTLIWQSEVELDQNSETVTKYKGLTGRYYWLKKSFNNNQAIFASEQLGDQQTVIGFNIASTYDTTFIDLTPKYNQGHIKLLDDIQVMEIELSLSIIDIYNVDFTRLYYFKQEAQYFKLNKINFEYGKNAIGEFIRVKN